LIIWSVSKGSTVWGQQYILPAYVPNSQGAISNQQLNNGSNYQLHQPAPVYYNHAVNNQYPNQYPQYGYGGNPSFIPQTSPEPQPTLGFPEPETQTRLPGYQTQTQDLGYPQKN
jgi:hypothetical protein